MNINSPIQYLKGVGEARAKQFNKLDVYTVGDLLYFLPRAYENWAPEESIHKAPLFTNCCISAVIAEPPVVSRISGGRLLTKCNVTDGETILTLIFFNNPYVADKLKEGEEFLFYGKLNRNLFGGREMIAPRMASLQYSGKIRPVYRQSGKLSSAMIENCVRNCFKNLTAADVPETLPQYLIEKYDLLPLYDALKQMHFPDSNEELFKARRRLVFEELLIFRLSLYFIKESGSLSEGIRLNKDYTDEYTQYLPFVLTKAQRKCISEIAADLSLGKPMNRLLQGDVGSGKTAVAAAAIYSCAKNGYQSALMAPTEVLAEQHYRTLQKLFEGTDIKVCLITGSKTAKEKREAKGQLSVGEADVAVGTHALLQSDVEFNRLGLVITDEQHRFGVNQRAALSAKGDNPHVLVMSATPIPRTLALIVYGDLDVSILDELPPGRQEIDTYKVDSSYRQRIYNFIKKHLDEGRQAYIICPLIDTDEEEDSPDLTAAKQLAEELSEGEFKQYRVGLLHGKMKSSDKDKIMRSFSEGEIQLLVSTVVVEVGVDVPNATVMVIENAEMFGLSQLHQLRGRIGRGQHKSTCILISDDEGENAKQRFEVFCATTDGFEIAEKDLELRGPGDFLGKRQHGMPQFKIADIFTDSKSLYAAQRIAEGILSLDPKLLRPQNAVLKMSVDRMIAEFQRAN
ncbi:MAG: ATP-dependent DNA helicase RecG [Clostridiales bacterium]|jgi:ATP-dependent DNA helicase RecG|nr:ATP-dependent DNA helicase RecG [Clostridiales bacterium]